MTEQKRGRGRPKKVVVEQKNPDCEPATKGYVKCLLRTMCDKSEHTHDDNVYSDGLRINLGLTMFLVFVGSVLFYFASGGNQTVMSVVVPTAIMSGVTCFVCAVTQDKVSYTQVYPKYPEAIQKYTPPEPACEKKKECE